MNKLTIKVIAEIVITFIILCLILFLPAGLFCADHFHNSLSLENKPATCRTAIEEPHRGAKTNTKSNTITDIPLVSFFIHHCRT